MGGLILDNILVFLFRLIAKAIADFRSRNWKTVTGTVENVAVDEGSYPYAEISYTYNIDGKERFGRTLKPFWYGSSARDYAKRFPASRKLVIRYRPDNPDQSFLREHDQ